jgi:hypothetical protein
VPNILAGLTAGGLLWDGDCAFQGPADPAGKDAAQIFEQNHRCAEYGVK